MPLWLAGTRQNAATLARNTNHILCLEVKAILRTASLRLILLDYQWIFLGLTPVLIVMSFKNLFVLLNYIHFHLTFYKKTKHDILMKTKLFAKMYLLYICCGCIWRNLRWDIDLFFSKFYPWYMIIGKSTWIRACWYLTSPYNEKKI